MKSHRADYPVTKIHEYTQRRDVILLLRILSHLLSSSLSAHLKSGVNAEGGGWSESSSRSGEEKGGKSKLHVDNTIRYELYYGSVQ